MATLARECAKVVVTDLDDPRGQAVISEIVSAGGDALLVHEDVSLEESWPEITEATERRFGRLDVMVANAGIGIMCEAVEMSLADQRRQTAVNLDGVIPVGEVRRRKSTEDAEPVSDCCKKSVRLREFRGAPDPSPSARELREFVNCANRSHCMSLRFELGLSA